MSGSAALVRDPPNNAGDDQQNQPDEVEQVARTLGWKSREELEREGKPTDSFAEPALFIARSKNPGAQAVNHSRTLLDRLDRMEHRHSTELGTVRQQLTEAVDTVGTVTTMLRTADARAYERARAELKAERSKAVETGDTAEFQRLDRELDELDKTKPAPPPDTRTPPAAGGTPPGAATPPAAGVAPVTTHPDVAAFMERNPWYQRDAEMMGEADTIHRALLTARPQMTPAQNLGEVERRMKAMFPDRTGGGSQTRPPPPVPPGNNDDPDDDEGRRASVVTPSSGAPPRPPRSNGRRTFDSMPKESKDAFDKYKRQLEGKGEPLTKEEWSREYWAQFPEDGT